MCVCVYVWWSKRYAVRFVEHEPYHVDWTRLRVEAWSVGGCWVFEEGSSRNRVQLFKLSEEMTISWSRCLVKDPPLLFLDRTTCTFQRSSNEQFRTSSPLPLFKLWLMHRYRCIFGIPRGSGSFFTICATALEATIFSLSLGS